MQHNRGRRWGSFLEPRTNAAARLKELGLRVIVTVAPLMPGRVGVNIDGFAGRFLD